MTSWVRGGLSLLVLLAMGGPARPAPGAGRSFIDPLDTLRLDREGLRGWRFATGDGQATMRLARGAAGHMSIQVDATRDRRGIWWALVERAATGLDLTLLQSPGHELRIEARVRVSHAPRRVNLQLLTQRTTDYHAHLMEFDIPDSGRWHTISMTTRGFQAGPGDTVFGHLALMDWGLQRYQVDLDYLKVEIVERAKAPPDQGDSVPYHPPVASPDSFAHKLLVAHDSAIDQAHPEVNLDDWSVRDGPGAVRVLTVDGTRDVILRWDLSAFAGRTVAGHGLLELTTQVVLRKREPVKDFGLLRVVEILGGDRAWDQRTVTARSLSGTQPLEQVFNPQMIIDWPAREERDGKTHLTISRSVLQRMIDGKTHGIALRALGAISASFHAREHDGGMKGPRLMFNLQP
jgi:hypothetical protein